MFDPHRIGPRRSSSYARNKGRVIQRRVVDTPSPGYTLTELEQLVPLMRKNGFIPEIPEPTPPPSPEFGRMVSYRVLVGGVDVSNNYRELTQEELEGRAVQISSANAYMLVVPNYNLDGVNVVVFKMFTVAYPGTYNFLGLVEGTRLYDMGSRDVPDSLVLVGENGTSVYAYLFGGAIYNTGETNTVASGSFAVPM